MRQGNDSFDVPCITDPAGVKNPEAMAKDARTALEWCEKFIEENGTPCSVRIMSNPHDFGSYPSIEIYYDWDPDHDCDGGDCSECEEYDRKRDKVGEFEKAYSERFKQWL